MENTPRIRATVVTIHAHRMFFFVAREGEARRDSAEHIFIDQRDCDFDLTILRRHDFVEVGYVDRTPRGLRGFDATFVGHPASESFAGQVTAIHPRFAFVEAHHDGARVMCCPPDFLRPSTFDEGLRIGAWLGGERIATPRGFLGIQVAPVRSACIPSGSSRTNWTNRRGVASRRERAGPAAGWPGRGASESCRDRGRESGRFG